MLLNQMNREPVQLDHNDQSTNLGTAHAGMYEPHANNVLGHHLAAC